MAEEINLMANLLPKALPGKGWRGTGRQLTEFWGCLIDLVVIATTASTAWWEISSQNYPQPSFVVPTARGGYCTNLQQFKNFTILFFLTLGGGRANYLLNIMLVVL